MHAETIFHNGTVLTVDADFSVAEAVAVAAGRILAVGTWAEVASAQGSDTELIDLAGGVLLPGFVEAHGHPTSEMAMLGPDSIDLRGTVCGSAEEVLRRLHARIADAGEGEWISGFGWDPLLLPDLPEISGAWLDEICPDQPLSILHNSAHSSWANTPALTRLGIDAQTPDPPASHYVRDAAGNPTGEAVEIPACMNLMGPGLEVTAESFPTFLANEMARYNACGVTTSGDLGFARDSFDAAREFCASEAATLRIRAYEMSDATLASPRTPGEGDEMFRQIGIKCWADGSPWIGNIATSFPYLDSPYTTRLGLQPGHRGSANYTPEDFERLVDAYVGAGWTMSCHAHGDLAIDMVLDAFETALQRHDAHGRRMRIEHCGAMRADQFERAQRLGVFTSIFIAHVYYWGDILASFLGQHGEEWMAVRRAADAGMLYSFHNDSPVTPCTPLLNIQTAVTRTDRHGTAHAPELTVGVEDAIRAQTCWSALHLQSEHEVGSIEVGKFADFVVLDADPRAVAPSTIADIGVRATYLAGRRVYAG